MKITVWTTAINTKHATSYSVHTSEEAAVDEIVQHCRDSWDSVFFEGETAPEDDALLREMYFDRDLETGGTEWAETASHGIEIGREAFDEVFSAAVELAIERRMNEDLSAILEEHQDKLQRRLIDPMAVALGIASGAICSLQEQIVQMRDMFADSDGAIAQSMEDGDNAYDEIKVLLDRYTPGVLPPISEDQTAANGAKLCADCGNDFWGECADQPRSDWRYQVANGDTSLGYWEWAAARLESEGDDVDPLEEQANEDECREALIEAGWREATAEEIELGFSKFQRADGEQRDDLTWAALAASLLAEV